MPPSSEQYEDTAEHYRELLNIAAPGRTSDQERARFVATEIMACLWRLAALQKLKIRSWSNKNQNHRQTLDLLLPELTSGEVAVSKLEIEVKGAA